MTYHRAFSPVRGSRTLTETTATAAGPIVLRLRGEPSTARSDSTSEPARVTWAEDVIDNEGMGKKKSKVCCIYHKPRAAGESSSESSSSEDDDSESNEDNSKARMAGIKGKRKAKHSHDNDECDHSEGGRKRISKSKGGRKSSPNAYEKMPKIKGKGSQTSRE